MSQVPPKTDGWFEISISETPLPPTSVDLYLIPSLDLHNCWKQVSRYGLPVFAYGPARMLAQSFELGCLDYLRSPWDYHELRYRSLRFLAPPRLDFPWGRIRIRGTCLKSGEMEQQLSYPELRILQLLNSRSRQLVSRRTLEYALWGRERPGSRALDMHIVALRKKLNLLAGKELKPSPIVSVRGRGYRLVHNSSTAYTDCG